MSPLEQLRAAQPAGKTPNDEAFEAFLNEVSLAEVQLDLLPTTDVERRHLARTRSAA